MSKGAREAVEAAGGSIEVLPQPRHDGGQGDKAPKGKGFERARAQKEAQGAAAKGK